MSDKPTYTAADLARWVGLGRHAVAKAGREGPLKPAKVNGRYDIQHPAARAWLADRGVDVDEIDRVTASPRSVTEVTSELGDSATVPLDSIEDMTLRQITDRWGDARELREWTSARKELAAARTHETRLARLEGLLIPRATVQAALGHLDALHRQLLRDLPTRLASSFPPQDRERALGELRDQVSQHLEGARALVRAAFEADDPSAPLREPADTAPATASTRTTAAALDRLRRNLREDTAPAITAAVHRDVARMGDGFDPDDTASRVATMIEAHIQTAFRDLHHPPREVPDHD